MKNKSIYKCNGHTFATYGDAVKYCQENNFRITATSTIAKGIHILQITSI
jgi:hypothetical protein